MRTTTGDDLPELSHLMQAEDIIKQQQSCGAFPYRTIFIRMRRGWQEKRGQPIPPPRHG